MPVCVSICLSLALSQAPLIPSFAQVYTVSARTRTLLFLPGKQPCNRIVCAHAHFVPNALECYQIRGSVDATINERTLTLVLFMDTEDLGSVFHLVGG